MDRVVRVLAPLPTLAASAAAQRGRLPPASRLYLWLNLVGAGILAVLAARERQLGFLLLEFCWAVVAAHSLLRTSRSPRCASTTGRSGGQTPAAGAQSGDHAGVHE